MSHDTMTITTTPLTVLCSSTLSVTTAVTVALAMVGPPAALDWQDVILPPLLLLRDARGVAGLTTAAAAISITDVFFRLLPLWGLNHWDLHHSSPWEHTHSRHMYILLMV